MQATQGLSNSFCNRSISPWWEFIGGCILSDSDPISLSPSCRPSQRTWGKPNVDRPNNGANGDKETPSYIPVNEVADNEVGALLVGVKHHGGIVNLFPLQRQGSLKNGRSIICIRVICWLVGGIPKKILFRFEGIRSFSQRAKEATITSWSHGGSLNDLLDKPKTRSTTVGFDPVVSQQGTLLHSTNSSFLSIVPIYIAMNNMLQRENRVHVVLNCQMFRYVRTLVSYLYTSRNDKNSLVGAAMTMVCGTRTEPAVISLQFCKSLVR